MSKRDLFISYMVPSNMVPNVKSQTYDYSRFNTLDAYEKVFNTNALAVNEDKTISFSFKDSPYVIDSLDGMFTVMVNDSKGVLARGWLDLPKNIQDQMWQLRQETLSHFKKQYSSEKYLAYLGFNYEASDAPMKGLRLGQSVHIFHEHVSAFSLDALSTAKIKTIDRHNRKDLVDIADLFIQKYFDTHGLDLSGFSFINSSQTNYSSVEELHTSPLFNGLNPYGFTFLISGDEKIFSNIKFQEEYNLLLKSFEFLHDEILSSVDINFGNREQNFEIKNKFVYDNKRMLSSLLSDNHELIDNMIRLYGTTNAAQKLFTKSNNSVLPRKHLSYSTAFYFHDDKLFLTLRPRVHCGSGTAEMFGIELCRYYDPAEFKDNFVNVKKHCDNFLDTITQKIPGFIIKNS